MDFYRQKKEKVIEYFNTDTNTGLSSENYSRNALVYGKNTLPSPAKKGLIKRVTSALLEPMLLILVVSFVITFGANIGKALKTGVSDVTESLGILLAIVLSVSITLIMEGSSERAFNALNKIYDNVKVTVIRDNKKIDILQKELTCGDIVVLHAGDKIVADGRLIDSNDLEIDESALTGESHASRKDANLVFNGAVPLAERSNSVFSGTFVSSGYGKMVVCEIGKNTEIGKIAGELGSKKRENSPLNQKLGKLGKKVSLIGLISALFVFIVSLFKLINSGSVTFDSVRALVMESIVLIVAAVPEGLPTIVAVSLAINMTKLAKENALIKKMTATETAGAVSVICSDKTGTLTQNKMSVSSVSPNGKEGLDYVILNGIYNNSLEFDGKIYKGNATELALINYLNKQGKTTKKSYKTISVIPFSSERKKMSVVIEKDGVFIELLKGAPEVVFNHCNLDDSAKNGINIKMDQKRKRAERVICFAHKIIIKEDEREGNDFIFDGFMSVKDPIRPEVREAVLDCKSAGIAVKILTGDNILTAFSIAEELGVANNINQVVNATEIEKLSDSALKKVLPKITVIARSTPSVKLRVVKLLKELGEVVAVTGDGVNDAPAIKNADVGIAMNSGSEITKEAADVVLLNDSFATVTKAVSFGRNVYKNLQRFILFQLSVNLTALIFITVCAVLGLESPFNTLQLLWINVIMDGPPALTLGLEPATDKLMKLKPVKRTDSIVSIKMLVRIVLNGLIMSSIIIAQHLYNFLGVGVNEKNSTTFTLFILMQLFNAFNSRTLDLSSVFKSIGKNKVMVYTFLAVFCVHVFIVQVCGGVFGITKLPLLVWLKCIGTASLIITFSEIYKWLYRALKGERLVKKINKNLLGA